MPRTLYRDQDALTVNYNGNNPVTFDFAYDPKRTTVKGSRLITIPVGSTASTGLHWHEEYTEYLRVVKGRASITLDGLTKEYGPDDGIVAFHKFHIHGFGRADRGDVSSGIAGKEDLVLEEWVDPEDGFKIVFFYNIFGLLLDSKGSIGPQKLIELLMVLDHVDEYPAVLPGPQWLNSIFIRLIMRTGVFVGKLLGYSSWYKEYTPESLWNVAKNRGKDDSTFR